MRTRKIQVDHSADPLMPDQIQKYINSLERDCQFQQALYVLIAVSTGLRYSDISRVSIGMVLRNDIVLNEKKTGKLIRRELSATSHDTAVHYISKLDLGADQSILSGTKNSVIRSQRMNERLKKDKEKYGLEIKKFSTHSLRKGFARMLFHASGDSRTTLYMISKCLNHSDPTITEKYIKIDQEELMNFMQTIEIKKAS